MSDKKTIQINPELFSLNGKNGTRKKRPTDPNKPIKIRAENKNNRTTKGKILRYIREQQEEQYEKLFNEKRSNKQDTGETAPTIGISTPNSLLGESSEFESSVNYFKSMEEEKKAAIKNNHNHTVRQYPQHNNTAQIPYELDNMYHHVPINDGTTYLQPRPVQLPPPTYGCLKNGNLPTYRAMMRQTQKNHQPSNVLIASRNLNQPPVIFPLATASQPIQPLSNPSIQIINPNNETSELSKPLAKTERERIEELKREQEERLKKISELKQIKQLVNAKNNPTPHKLKYLKRKKTLKRTYYIGKSKVFPKVGVLVSNKTIRKNVTTKAQLLKQVPMEEIKKYLIKHGFIKIGTTAPNDVLRKIYESAIMMGGEIQNYNSENLLYNYLNGS
jgi:hypothetical protein